MRRRQIEHHAFEDVDGRNLCDRCDEYVGAPQHQTDEGNVVLSWSAIVEQNRAGGLVPVVLAELRDQGRRL